MKKAILMFSMATLTFIVTCCKDLYPNNLITNSTLISIDEDSTKIGYKAYQTGIDNYRFRFYVVSRKDTIGLFERYQNDTVFKESHFQPVLFGDTIYVYCPLNYEAAETNYKHYYLVLKPVKNPMAEVEKAGR